MRFAILFVGMTAMAQVHAGKCEAVSGPGTTALVELYTSEGCNSCPPADRWLSTLKPGKVVPLALHVDYWDYIGWKDPYAKREFSQRQRSLSRLQRMALVYTPQVLLQGRDFRQWGTAAFDKELARINAKPAAARIRLAITGMSAKAVTVEADAEILDRSHAGDAALFVAAYESRLSSKVTAGENRGELLNHDYVALEWFEAPQLRARRELPLLPKAVPANSGVAAFVQNRRTGEVLQALMQSGC
jgi:hypothetical protein